MSNPWEPKLLIYWNCDSFSQESVCENGPLPYRDAYLGHLEYREGIWGYVLKGHSWEPCPNYAKARETLQRIAIGIVSSKKIEK